MSFEKVTVEKVNGECHMASKIPNQENKYYPNWLTFTKVVMGFVKQHTGKGIGPHKRNDKNGLPDHLFNHLKKHMHYSNDLKNVEKLSEYTRQMDLNLYEPDIRAFSYEKVFQNELLNILRYTLINVHDEVELKPADEYYGPEIYGQCDLLLNTVVVELKRDGALFNKMKQGCNEEDLWKRLLLQAWCYINHLSHSVDEDGYYIPLKDGFTKLVISTPNRITLMKVVCDYGSKNGPQLYITKIYDNNRIKNPKIPTIAKYITWFNFYHSKISEEDIQNDFYFYFYNKRIMLNKLSDKEIHHHAENYKACVLADFSHLGKKHKDIINVIKKNMKRGYKFKSKTIGSCKLTKAANKWYKQNITAPQKPIKKWFYDRDNVALEKALEK